MKRMMIKGMLWKELKLFVSSSLFLIILYVLVFVGAYYSNIEALLEANALDDDTFFSICVTLVIFIMSLAGSLVISQSTGVDKREGVLNSLLGTASSAMYIWMGQLLFSVAVGYVFSMLGLGFIFIIMYIQFDIFIQFQFIFYLELIIMLPAFCAFVLSIYSFLLWITKNTTLQMIISILPVFSYMLAIVLLDYINEIMNVFQTPVIIAVGLLSFLGIILVGLIVNKMPKSVFVSKI